MSTAIARKFEYICKEKGLSQQEFAQKVGISINTLKGIIKRNSSPRVDVVEKVALVWPEYSLWLLTGMTEPGRGQISPASTETMDFTNHFIIVDSVDARFMDKCIVKPIAFKKIIFIQNSEEKSDLGVIITLENKIMYQISAMGDAVGAVWVSAGNLNFNSTGGGKMALEVFRNWLEQENKDLIETAEYSEVSPSLFDNIYKTLNFSSSELKPASDPYLVERFNSWVSGTEY